MSIEDDIKQKASELGLIAGITSAESFAAELAILKERASRGITVPFVTYEPVDRVDPGTILPGVQSLIAIAMPYTELAPGPIARYARGPDYHHVLKEKMLALADWLKEHAGPGVQSAVAVDTSPLIDRAVAARAGLGFYGKHGGIITRTMGSLVTLGTILTTLRLQPDPPVSRDCGHCDLCLRACPTGAIVAPGVVDPGRCLSTWTQMRGPLPEWVRESLGTRVFGCDTCQEVCPYNLPHLRGQAYEGVAAGARTGDGETSCNKPSDLDHCPELCAIATMDEAAFEERFAHTAAGWRGRNVLRRNAVVALGDLGDRRALPVLDRLADTDPSPVVREHADWARKRVRDAGKRIDS